MSSAHWPALGAVPAIISGLLCVQWTSCGRDACPVAQEVRWPWCVAPLPSVCPSCEMFLRKLCSSSDWLRYFIFESQWPQSRLSPSFRLSVCDLSRGFLEAMAFGIHSALRSVGLSLLSNLESFQLLLFEASQPSLAGPCPLGSDPPAVSRRPCGTPLPSHSGLFSLRPPGSFLAFLCCGGRRPLSSPLSCSTFQS